MEFCNSPENENRKGFVCVKSDFNLTILIDVAFYFKCLQRDVTTDLCGPVSNVTHTHVRLSKPSDQWPACNVNRDGQFSEGANPMDWEAELLPQNNQSGKRGFSLETLRPGSRFYRTAVLMLSASSSCGPSPLAHTEGFRRISTPKEGMKGSGASVQGSARGLTFDLLSSIN